MAKPKRRRMAWDWVKTAETAKQTPEAPKETPAAERLRRLSTAEAPTETDEAPQQICETPQPTPDAPKQTAETVAIAAPAPMSDEEQGALVQLRSIVLGSLLGEQEQAIERIESRILEQANGLCAELDALVRRLDDRIEGLESRLARDRGGVGEQMISQEQLLTSSIDERSTQVAQLVKDGVANLRTAKFDRGDFSSFLARLAGHLESEAPETHEEESAVEPSPLHAVTRPPWHPVRESA